MGLLEIKGKIPVFVCVLFITQVFHIAQGEVIPSPLTEFGFPDISPGVTLSRVVDAFDGQIVGPINDIEYGPNFTYPFDSRIEIPTGQTGWVNSSYIIPSGAPVNETYRLFFLISDVDLVTFGDEGGESALAIDNIVATTSLPSPYSEGFESGIPVGQTDPWLVVSPSGSLTVNNLNTTTSLAAPNIDPTEGDSFGVIDTLGVFDQFNNDNPGNSTLVNTSALFPGLTSGTTLFSPQFQLNPGDKISLDLNFLTQEADPLADFAMAQLWREVDGVPDPFDQFQNPEVTLFTASGALVPEPSTYVLYSVVLLTLGFLGFKSKKNKASAAAS